MQWGGVQCYAVQCTSVMIHDIVSNMHVNGSVLQDLLAELVNNSQIILLDLLP